LPTPARLSVRIATHSGGRMTARSGSALGKRSVDIALPLLILEGEVSCLRPPPVAWSSGRRVAPWAHVASDPEISIRGTSVDWQDGGFLPAAPTCVLAKDIA